MARCDKYIKYENNEEILRKGCRSIPRYIPGEAFLLGASWQNTPSSQRSDVRISLLDIGRIEKDKKYYNWTR